MNFMAQGGCRSYLPYARMVRSSEAWGRVTVVPGDRYQEEAWNRWLLSLLAGRGRLQ